MAVLTASKVCSQKKKEKKNQQKLIIKKKKTMKAFLLKNSLSSLMRKLRHEGCLPQRGR